MNWKNLEEEVLCQGDISTHFRDQLVKEEKFITSLLLYWTFFSPHVEDELIWWLNPFGVFSVKSVYHNIEGESVGTFNWKKIWIKRLIPKINYFWLAMAHGRILMIDYLNKRGFSFINMCVLCYKDLESINHLFLYCQYMKEVYDDMLRDIKMSWILLESLKDLIE